MLRHPFVRLDFEEARIGIAGVIGVGVGGVLPLDLIHDVTRIKMVENAHELAKIDVRDSGVPADHEHVLVVLVLRRAAEVRRPGHNDWIIPQGIDQHELVVDVVVPIETREPLPDEILQVARQTARPRRR